MSDHPSDTNENRFRATVAGALAFVSFGLVTALVLWVADLKAGADAAVQGIFTPEQVDVRDANLSEVKKAQASLYDGKKVSAAMTAIAGAAPKKAKPSATIVPGSPTDLKNQAAAAAKAKKEEDAKAPQKEEEASDDAPSEKGAGEKAKPAKSGDAKGKAKGDKVGKGKPAADNQ